MVSRRPPVVLPSAAFSYPHSPPLPAALQPRRYNAQLLRIISTLEGSQIKDGEKVRVPESSGELQVWSAEAADELSGHAPEVWWAGDPDIPAVAALLQILRIRHRFSFRSNLWRARRLLACHKPLTEKR